jgi:hypothetical protein
MDEIDPDSQPDPRSGAEPGKDLSAPEGANRRTPRLLNYVLLVALIALVCIVAVSLVGRSASSKRFHTLESMIQ